MEDLYAKMLDSDNFSQRQRLVREQQKNIEYAYNKYPGLKKIDTTISDLQKELANSLAKRLKGQAGVEIDSVKTKLNDLLAKKEAYLQKYGIPQDYKEPKWKCDKCQDRGKLYLDNNIVVCPCQQDNSIDQRQKKSGLSLKLKNARFQDTQFSKYKPKDRQNSEAVYTMVQKYLANHGKLKNRG